MEGSILMSKYIGTVGQKISAEVKLTNIYEYTDYKFSYYGTTHYIYTMQDAEENVLVWKTTSYMNIQEGEEFWYLPKKGDTLTIKGTVKEHSEYKGTKQTVLTRCRYSLVEKAPVPPTKEELEAKKCEEQFASIKGKDFIWEMPYKQYKEHYSDCETVAGSYECDRHGNKTIKVIIREGRLKNSGVRGEHFHTYQLYLTDDKGKEGYGTYRAVCFENAVKQHLKECKKNGYTPVYENGEVKLGRIFL